MSFWNKLKKSLLTSFGLSKKSSPKRARMKSKVEFSRKVKIKKTSSKKSKKSPPKKVKVLRTVKKKKAVVRDSKKKSGKKVVRKIEKVRKLNEKQKKVGSTKKAAEKQLGEFVGTVTHYFPNVEAGVIRIEKTELKEGDQILILGETSRFKQPVKSMQINRIPIEHARLGEEIGLKVKERVREGDKVYKIT